MNNRFQMIDSRFKWALSFLLILSSSFYHLKSATPANAQAVSLSVTPPVLELLLRPNQPLQQTIVLHTDGADLEITPELYRATPIDSLGHVRLDSAPINPTDLPLIITSSPPLNEPFTLSSREITLPLTLTLSAASSDVTQDVYLAVVFRTRALDTTLTTSSSLPAISSLLLLTLTPDGLLPINLSVQNFDLPLFHDSFAPLSLHPQLANQTGVMIRPVGSLSILNPRGVVIQTLPLYPHLVAGNATRDLVGNCAPDLAPAAPCPLTWIPHLSNLGPYRFRLTITTQGGTQLSTTEKVIWLFPLRLIILCLSIFLFLLLTLRLVRSRLKVV